MPQYDCDLRKCHGAFRPTCMMMLIGVMIPVPLQGADDIQKSPTHQIDCEGVTFTLPKGLTVTKVAGPPLIKWPIVADWDQEGRLVVVESGGVGWPIQEHNQKLLHSVVRLVDRNGDGKFDKKIVAADQLPFLEGVLCFGADLLVAAPPQILRLTDSDGDGYCENRSIWFDGTTVTNCANDLHGPYLGRDGWIYWCKGAFGEQSHSLVDGRQFTSSAAHIYRRRFSGGPIEPVISGGMDNPVEVAFLDSGEKFFTSTFLQHPADGRRDGIGHAVYGSVFGKDHRVVNDMTNTGPLMTPMVHLGPAAPSGLMEATRTCRTRLTGDDQSPLLMAALFNLHKVSTHRLIPDGATYQSLDQDLISTDRVDVHPTDVIEDGNGNVLMIDTGGWYDLCCPTSRIDQKTAEGGIYRIAPINGENSSPRQKKIVWTDLDCESTFEVFDDPRPWVRREAEERFGSFGDQAVRHCVSIVNDSNRSIEMRKAAIWALCRIESSSSEDALIEMIESQPASLLMPLLHAISIRRISQSQPAVEPLLSHSSLAVRRVAAQVLGRVSTIKGVEPLLESCNEATGDRHLQHALTYALIEIGRRSEPVNLMAKANSDAALHAALIATRELGWNDQIDPVQLIEVLDHQDEAFRRTAIELMAQNTAWAPLAINRLKSAWSTLDESSGPPEFLSTLLDAWNDQPSIARLMDDWILRPSALPTAQQHFLADHFNVFFSTDSASERAKSVVDWLSAADPPMQNRIRAGLGTLPSSNESLKVLAPNLSVLALQSDSTTERLEWLGVMPSGTTIEDSELAMTVLNAIGTDDSAVSVPAARVLDRVRLKDVHAEQLVESLNEIQPRHLSTVIESIHRSGSQKLQHALLKKLPSVAAARTLRDGFLSNLFRRSPETIRHQAEEVEQTLLRPSVDIQTALEKALAELPEGDSVRGLQVFRGSKASCSSCHRMGYIGQNVGPVLTRIGGTRTREALLEAILFPSSRLEQSYQSTLIQTFDGKVYNGLLQSKSSESVQLRLDADRVVSIALDDIEAERPSDISVMPNGLEKLLTRQDLADLLALLQEAR